MIKTNEYISRDDLYRDAYWAEAYSDSFAARDVLYKIENFPAADVAPVVHAAWVPADNAKNLKACSNCHGGEKRLKWNPLSIKYEGWTHCPHCGAKMDVETP